MNLLPLARRHSLNARNSPRLIDWRNARTFSRTCLFCDGWPCSIIVMMLSMERWPSMSWTMCADVSSKVRIPRLLKKLTYPSMSFPDPKPTVYTWLCGGRRQRLIITAVLPIFPLMIDGVSDIEVQETRHTTCQSEKILIFWLWDEFVRCVVRSAESWCRTTASTEMRAESALTRQVREWTHGF